MARSPATTSTQLKRDSRSLNQQIVEQIRGKILSGEWPPGFRIPFEHELTDQFGCSRMTVNKALSQLANAGFIERRRRSGSFVAQPKSQESILSIHDIKAEVTASGQPYRFAILSRRERTASPADTRYFNLGKNTPILAISVLHYAADQPFVLEDRIINLAAVPEASDEKFADTPPGSWLLDLIPWTEAEHIIRAEPATATVARRLLIAGNAACLVIERRTWQHGKPVTWVRLTYPGARHQLMSSIRPGHAPAP